MNLRPPHPQRGALPNCATSRVLESLVHNRYVKTNKYWFRKRRGLFSPDLGWGWTPISWEGWTLVGANVAGTIAIAKALGLDEDTPNSDVVKIVAGIAAVAGVSVLISIKKCRPED